MSAESGTLQLRDAEAGDAQAIWEINNEPSVREASFSTDEIPWTTHLQWFTGVLKSSTRKIFLSCKSEEILCVTRFDQLTQELSEVSIAAKSGHRSRGVGRWTLQTSAHRYFQENPSVKAIRAYIKPENVASQKAFQASGYAPDGESEVRNTRVLCYLLHRSPATNCREEREH